MGLSELMLGWARYPSSGHTESFTKVNMDATREVHVVSLPNPGEWYIEVMDFRNQSKYRIPEEKDKIINSLMDALYMGERELNAKD